MIRRTHAHLAAVVLAVTVAVPAAAQEMPRTFQEVNDFRAGPTPFEPLMQFWYDLDEVSADVSIRPLTETLLGREVVLVTIARPHITTPEDALRSGKAIVFIGNSPHGNEPAGKEASQLIARELVAGSLQHVLDDAIVLFVPLLNPDGGEVRSRVNEEGFDLNRDYIKLESQEVHAVVTQVLNEWTPDIHIDTHHGGSAPYTLTWQGTLNPAADAELRAYTYDVIIPRIRAELRSEDYDGFDYSGESTVNGVRGWGSTSIEPRKHHVYTGMINTIGLLFETPSSSHRVLDDGTRLEEIPQEERYYHQVRGQYLGMKGVLETAAERPDELRAITTGARMRAIANGATYEESDQIVLEYELISRGQEPIWVRDQEAPLGFTLDTREIFLSYRPTRTTTRPLGYVLPPAMARVLPVLLDHDIEVHRFTEDTELEVEVYEATGIENTEYFQGHYLKAATGVVKTTETVEVPAGSFWISTAQSRGNLIAYIMEPETDDNLITWGWTDHILEVEQAEDEDDRQEVPMMRVVRQQPMPTLEVVPFNAFNRNRYFQPQPN